MNRFESFYYQRIKPLFLHKPLYTEETEFPFFILSSGRSGSTLLRKLLLENSSVIIPPESNDLIPKLAKFYLRHNHRSWEYIVKGCAEIIKEEPAICYWKTDLTAKDGASIPIAESIDHSLAGIVQAFYMHYADTHGLSAAAWGDKTPFLVFRLSWVNLVFPFANYVFLIRDSRAVVSSFLQMNKGYSVETASARWLKAVVAMEKQIKRIGNDRGLFIKYEDLVSDTEKELGKVISFLGLVKKESGKEPVFLGDDVLEHHKNVNFPVTSSFTKKWENELTEEQIRRVTDLTKGKLKQFGYL